MKFANIISVVNSQSTDWEEDIVILTLELNVEGPALAPQIRIAFARSLKFADTAIYGFTNQIICNVLINFVQKIRNLEPEIIRKTETNEVESQDSTLRLARITKFLVVTGRGSVGLNSQIERSRAEANIAKLVKSLTIGLHTHNSPSSCVE